MYYLYCAHAIIIGDSRVRFLPKLNGRIALATSNEKLNCTPVQKKVFLRISY